MIIKICGITNYEDAKLAAALGADILGFIFYKKSPRYIPETEAFKIIENIPDDVKKAAVFVNRDFNEAAGILKKGQFDYIQLHGDEPQSKITEYKKLGYSVIRAIRAKNEDNIDILKNINADFFLIDSYSKNLYGGTGKISDWDFAKEASKKYKVILSGGLNPKNILKAVKYVNPYGVDFCSGIETEPGKKDADKMRLLFTLLKEDLRQ